MKYKVVALTPLLVGDGRELSPIDYMVWKDQVNVLDQNRIFKLLARGPRLDGYLAQLQKATKLDFASWGGFAQNFSQRRIPFENPQLTDIWNAAPSDFLFIPTFSATYRGAYLPASALKGALRTGLVFSRWNEGVIDRLAGSLEGNRLPRRLAEPAEVHVGASQMRIISAADSGPVPSSAFKIFLTRVASLDTRQPTKPQLSWKVAGRGSVPPPRISDSTASFAEMAPIGTNFEGAVQERTFLEQPELTKSLGWKSSPDLRTIVEAANQYAAAQLKIHSDYAERSGLPALQQSIQRLDSELNLVQNQQLSCLLCLGRGGGFVSKSGYLDTGLGSFRKILRAAPFYENALREGAVFPKTRRIVFTGGQPTALPGWVKLEFE